MNTLPHRGAAMSDNKKDFDRIQKKMKDLAEKESRNAMTLFSYIEAILKILSDKGITNTAEFQEYLVKAKKDLSRKIRDAEFKKLMTQFEDEKKKDKE